MIKIRYREHAIDMIPGLGSGDGNYRGNISHYDGRAGAVYHGDGHGFGGRPVSIPYKHMSWGYGNGIGIGHTGTFIIRTVDAEMRSLPFMPTELEIEQTHL